MSANKAQAFSPGDGPPFVRRTPLGIELRLKVIPGASRSAIVGALGDKLKIKVAAPPEGGKANEAVVKLLAEWLNNRSVEIISGHAHAEKVARVNGVYELDAACLSKLKGHA